jgi:hypothetical protein
VRIDLPDPADPCITAGDAQYAASVLTMQGCKTAVAIGYGVEQLVTPAMWALKDSAPQYNITLTGIVPT